MYTTKIFLISILHIFLFSQVSADTGPEKSSRNRRPVKYISQKIHPKSGKATLAFEILPTTFSDQMPPEFIEADVQICHKSGRNFTYKSVAFHLTSSPSKDAYYEVEINLEAFLPNMRSYHDLVFNIIPETGTPSHTASLLSRR